MVVRIFSRHLKTLDLATEVPPEDGRRRERLRLVQQGPRGGELAAAGEHLRPGCPPPGLGVDIGGPGSYLGFLRHHPAA